MRPILVSLTALSLTASTAFAESTIEIEISPLLAPRTASPGKERVAEILERRTADIRKEATEDGQECARNGQGENFRGYYFSSESRVLLDTRSLYSLEVVGESACSGAAHPNDWQYGLTYDMTIGKRYNPLSL